MLEIRCGEEIRLLIDEKQDDAVGWGVGVGVDVIPLFNIEFGAVKAGVDVLGLSILSFSDAAFALASFLLEPLPMATLSPSVTCNKKIIIKNILLRHGQASWQRH